ncbi:hypothetical protein GARC_4191 [Paraglaciecola arctica BSs20135]|uniref:Uncharacterized protein n=1 Tax=Paraglaciecola arctica BSs20135 TaxID=493475 RepID=K6YWL8_9ALTE|nr:hypothetical protein GARC_4191 [Paraglaciecola arctica BSs20135]
MYTTVPIFIFIQATLTSKTNRDWFLLFSARLLKLTLVITLCSTSQNTALLKS